MGAHLIPTLPHFSHGTSFSHPPVFDTLTKTNKIMTRLSAAAQRCRREYNNAYWERKASAQAFDAILTAVPDVEHAEASNDPAEYIAQLEREVQSLTRRCGALSRQIRAYQEIIGNAILAAQERETTTVSVVELAANN